MGYKWIFKKKSTLSSEYVIHYKAHLVAKGYNQKEEVDYSEMFSPIDRHTSIHALLTLVATLDMELYQFDVKTSFPHGRLKEDILMQQPKGFELEGKESFVYRLERSLYGLKQSPRLWYKRFNEFIVSHGYTISPYDSCFYHNKVKDGSHIYLLLYVDNMLIASQNR